MIIAEFCQKHQGKREILWGMIHEAKEAGARFAKVQAFFADDLNPEWKCHYDYYKEMELSWDTLSEFVVRCKSAGVLPMVSVYTSKYLPEIQECGFEWVKVGSADSHKRNLIRTYKMAGFNVVLSSGGQELKEMPLITPLEGLLHCVSRYPHSPYDSNLLRMLEIKYKYSKIPYGFSSHVDPEHSEWFLPSFLASYLGASFIEHHFTTVDREKTKDGKVSLNYEQLKMLCDFDGMEKVKQSEVLGGHRAFQCFKQTDTMDTKEAIQQYRKRWHSG